MRHFWGTRRRLLTTAIVAIGVAVALATVVLPAFATGGYQIPPQSGKGVIPTDFPTGGKTTDCTLFKSTAPSSFQVTSPATKTYTAPSGATFTLTVSSDRKYIDFTSTGAAVYDVSVAPPSTEERDDDDPTGTAWYQYSRAATGPVMSDTGLHTTKGRTGLLHSISRVTFCYAASASVSGTVVNDANNNKQRDSGETGNTGWTVNLYKAGATTPTANTTTGAGGAYSFLNVPVGLAYTVCLVTPTGWSQTFPTAATAPPCGSTAGESTAGLSLPTVLTSKSGLDFGLVQLGSISGTTFADSNNNGSNDQGDSPQSATVSLLQGGSQVGSSITTGADGKYTFASVPVTAQGYTVCETAPGSNWSETLPNSDTGNKATCSGQFAIGYSVTLTAGAPNPTGFDFGSIQVASISGTAFEDVNNNGQHDAGDNPKSGLNVTLYPTSGSPVITTTAGDGSYTFAGVPVVPQGYTVCEASPGSNWAQTLPNSGTNVQVACHAGESPLGYSITLTTSAGAPLVDFGSVQTIPATCDAPFGTQGSYQAQLAPDGCTTGKSLVFGYSNGEASDGHDKFAFLRPPFGTTVTPGIPDVEHITWGLPANHHQIVVLYNDDPQGDRPDAKVMTYCLTDPRIPPGSGFTLPPGVVPNVLLQGETSCILNQTTSLFDNTFTVDVYSLVDGWRGVGP